MPHYALAVDIGGTFTDVVLRDASGRTWVDKTLTTPKSLETGFFTAVDAVLKTAGIAPAASPTCWCTRPPSSPTR